MERGTATSCASFGHNLTIFSLCLSSEGFDNDPMKLSEFYLKKNWNIKNKVWLQNILINVNGNVIDRQPDCLLLKYIYKNA